jgi:hypothetical protein
MKIVFQIDGGLGKCIMATAVCEAIKKQEPDAELIVVCGYPDVFLNNPFVDKVYAFGEASYFYQDVIMSGDVRTHLHNPYLETNHILRKEHLLKTWTRMFGYLYNGEFPQIYLTDRERSFHSQKYLSEKPLMVLQTNGGAGTVQKYSWARDMPPHIAQRVVQEFEKDYTILHIRRDDQVALPGTIQVTDNFRSICTALLMSEKRVLIDSFVQHAAAAFNLHSTVLWVCNLPGVFGYDVHTNIEPNPFTKKPEIRNSMFHPFNIEGEPLEFPYHSEEEIFDADRIIEAIKRT